MFARDEKTLRVASCCTLMYFRALQQGAVRAWSKDKYSALMCCHVVCPCVMCRSGVAQDLDVVRYDVVSCACLLTPVLQAFPTHVP